MKVVFFGSSKYVIPVIDVLKENFQLSLVITTDNGKAVDSYCKTRDIPFISLLKLGQEAIKKIEETKPNIAVVAAFGIIIPQIVLDIFPKGILNIHPSLLPFYRGPTPIQTALLNGDKKTGVTIMKIDAKVDNGPILTQEEYEIKQDDNSQLLLVKLFQKGADLLREVLKDYANGKISLKEQDHNKATFTKMLSRNDGFMNIKNPPSPEHLDAMIRAYYPWPGVWTRIYVTENEKDIRIVKFLPDKRIQVEGGREMNYKDFINGYSNANKKLIEFLKTGI